MIQYVNVNTRTIIVSYGFLQTLMDCDMSTPLAQWRLDMSTSDPRHGRRGWRCWMDGFTMSWMTEDLHQHVHAWLQQIIPTRFLTQILELRVNSSLRLNDYISKDSLFKLQLVQTLFFSSKRGSNFPWISAFVSTTETKRQDARVTLVCKEAEEMMKGCWQEFLESRLTLKVGFLFDICSFPFAVTLTGHEHSTSGLALREAALTACVHVVFRIYHQLQFSSEIVFTCSAALGDVSTDNVLTNGCINEEDFF